MSKLLAVRVGGMPKGALPPFLCADVFSAALINQKPTWLYRLLAAVFQRGFSMATIASPIKQKVTDSSSRFERNVIPSNVTIAIMPPYLGWSSQRNAQAVSESTIALE